jgi:hypothetical protein
LCGRLARALRRRRLPTASWFHACRWVSPARGRERRSAWARRSQCIRDKDDRSLCD